MRADWKADALHYIEQATKDLAPDATLSQRRSALNAAAGSFHQGTSWGKKVWSRESRKYLELHGLAPRTPETASLQSKIHARMATGDITFPFREEGKP